MPTRALEPDHECPKVEPVLKAAKHSDATPTLHDYVASYAGFCSLMRLYDADEEKTTEEKNSMSAWEKRRVTKIQLWACTLEEGDLPAPRVFFVYNDGVTTEELAEVPFSMNQRKMKLVDTISLEASEHIVGIRETRINCHPRNDVGTQRFDTYHLTHIEFYMSSGRMCPVILHNTGDTHVTECKSRLLWARAGHMVIDYDMTWCLDEADFNTDDASVKSHFYCLYGQLRYFGHTFRSGIIQMPIDGNFSRVADLFLEANITADAAKMMRNDFCDGNLAHVLGSIGGRTAAAGIVKLKEIGAGQLLTQLDKAKRAPAFYAALSAGNDREELHHRECPQYPHFCFVPCIHALLQQEPSVLHYKTESGMNLAHIASFRRAGNVLSELTMFKQLEMGSVEYLFSDRDRTAGNTPAHYAITMEDDDAVERDVDADDVIECLQELHDGLKECMSPLIEFRRGTTQNFAHALAELQQEAVDAVSLCVRNNYSLTPAHYATTVEHLNFLLEIGGLKYLESDFITMPSLFTIKCPRHIEEYHWKLLRGAVLSSPKYLSLRARQAWLSASMASSIPEGDEGLTLDVADWQSPLLGACAAFGIDIHTGQLTSARPARLASVRSIGGDAAEGDGLRRQWLNAATKQLLEPDNGLFELAPDGVSLVPRPHSANLVPDHLAQYALLGRMIGLALLHGDVIACLNRLNLFVLASLFGRSMSKSDALASLDPENFKSLEYIRQETYKQDGISLEELSLTFSWSTAQLPDYITSTSILSETELKSGGAEMPVTEDNKNNYMALLEDHLLTRWRKGVDEQLVAIKGGIAVLLTPPLERQAGRLFSLVDIKLLLGGIGEITDKLVDDWQQHTRYGGGLSPDCQLTLWFWEAVRSFSLEQRARLLAFSTGSSSPPALGFQRLPGFDGTLTQFTLDEIHAGTSQLPTASTCFAILRLPRYKSAQELRDKLLQAITMSEGFAEAAVAQE